MIDISLQCHCQFSCSSLLQLKVLHDMCPVAPTECSSMSINRLQPSLDDDVSFRSVERVLLDDGAVDVELLSNEMCVQKRILYISYQYCVDRCSNSNFEIRMMKSKFAANMADFIRSMLNNAMSTLSLRFKVLGVFNAPHLFINANPVGTVNGE